VKNATIMAVSKEKPENKFNSMSLEDLDLSVRSYNCLKRNGLKTVQDLCNMKESELMTVRNLGKKSYKEILDKLASFGLSLQHDDVKK
jgi:DNA-directed RNA polymerase subunit alpha